MLDLWEHVPEIVIALHVLFFILVMFIERKRPVSTISWLIALLFLPIFGIILYIFIGSARTFNVKRKFSRKRQIDKQYNDLLKEQLHYIKTNQIDFKNPEIRKYLDMILLHMNSDSLFSEDNTVEVITDAKIKYEMLFEDIRNATKSIHIMYYIFRDDNIGNQLIDLLTQKVQEGVEVRLIYDRFGNVRTRFKSFRRLIDVGGKVIRFLPNPFFNILRVNYRNHRKIVVIDGKIGYLGGINIGDEYMGFDKKRKPWRDTHMRITGSAIVTLQLRFLMDWWYLVDEEIDEMEAALKYFSVTQNTGSTALQIASSGPDAYEQQIQYGILKMIYMAKNTLYIQTPYFIPDDSIMDALKIAKMSGVDVRVMIPGVPDKKFVYYATLSYIEELLNNDIKVYKYHGFLHSKMVVMDEEVSTIGTMNIDLRGFKLAFEVNAFIYDRAVSTQCKQIFLNDIHSCSEIHLDEFKNRNVLEKCKEAVFRLLSPLM